jgi:hypothetical protein
MRKDAVVRRQHILELALEGYGPREIAERLRVTDRAIRGHLNAPAMTAELRRLQDARLRQLTRRALAQAETALAVLQAVAEDTAQPASARVAAARALLDTVARLLETTDLVERVEALEAAQTARAEGRSA